MIDHSNATGRPERRRVLGPPVILVMAIIIAGLAAVIWFGSNKTVPIVKPVPVNR